MRSQNPFIEPVDCKHCDHSWDQDFTKDAHKLLIDNAWRMYFTSKCEQCGHYNLIKLELDIHVVVSNAEETPESALQIDLVPEDQEGI